MSLLAIMDDGTTTFAVPRQTFVRTDAGRWKSKRPRQKLDCVVRAFATALRLDYDAAYDKLAEAGRKCGRSTPKKVWQALAGKAGQRHSFPAAAGEPRVNIVTFCRDHGYEGYWIVQSAGHVFAVIDGAVHDDAEPRWNACVYAAWNCTK